MINRKRGFQVFLFFFLLLFSSSCSLLEPASIGGVEKVADVVDKVEIQNIQGLLWWQWVCIGMLIPSPWEIVGSMFRAFKTYSSGGIL